MLRIRIDVSGRLTHTITARRTTEEQQKWNKYEWSFQSHEGSRAKMGGYVVHKFDKGILNLVRIIIISILRYRKER